VPKTKDLSAQSPYNNIESRFPNHVFLYELCLVGTS